MLPVIKYCFSYNFSNGWPAYLFEICAFMFINLCLCLCDYCVCVYVCVCVCVCMCVFVFLCLCAVLYVILFLGSLDLSNCRSLFIDFYFFFFLFFVTWEEFCVNEMKRRYTTLVMLTLIAFICCLDF